MADWHDSRFNGIILPANCTASIRPRPERCLVERGTGRLLEDYSVVCEAAERAVRSGGVLVAGGLEVTRLGGGGYEVRQNGLLVFRCRTGSRPEVFTPGEWIVRLVKAGDRSESL